MTGAQARRRVLVLAAVLAMACGACARNRAPGAGGGTTTVSATEDPPSTPAATAVRPPSPSPSPSARDTPPPPPATRTWQPSGDEVHVEVKQRAAEAALALTTYEADSALQDVVATVTDDDTRARELTRVAAELYRPDGWSRGRIVYPQMGGLRATRASVMVVVEQTVQDDERDDGRRIVTRTLDVRLVRTEQGWAFDELASAGGSPAPRPDALPPAAEAVLDSPRIELPDSARWDVHRGEIATALLEVMAELAEQTPYGVVVLSSGHPWDVFETGRQSSHTRGHAVDVYRLGDELVVDGRAATGTRTHQTVQWLFDTPQVSNLGSPWRLDGHGGRSFTDAVHQDHLHVSASVG